MHYMPLVWGHMRTLFFLLFALTLAACGHGANAQTGDSLAPQPPKGQKTDATPSPGKVTLKLVRQLHDRHVRSPKSVVFSADGKSFYVNALEGWETLVFDAETLTMDKVIRHEFSEEDHALFLDGETTLFDYGYNSRKPAAERNCFSGKPVESAFSHNGRYLWVTYYRRSWDRNASSPSAVAIIDTRSNEIVRVMPTGPLPKMLVPSPDGKRMAIIHWGDNTAGIVDITSDNPGDFVWERLLTSGNRLDMKNIGGNRDSNCGQCLRGAVFTADSRHLIIGKMGGGGITAFDMQDGRNLGTLLSVAPTPRHLALGPDGTRLYVSSNISGKVSELEIDRLLAALTEAKGENTYSYRGRELHVGKGARTLAVSKDGKRLYVVCNNSSTLVVVDIPTWSVVAKAKVAPYAVGLAISPDERRVITTSQGRHGHGGHVVSVFDVQTGE